MRHHPLNQTSFAFFETRSRPESLSPTVRPTFRMKHSLGSIPVEEQLAPLSPEGAERRLLPRTARRQPIPPGEPKPLPSDDRPDVIISLPPPKNLEVKLRHPLVAFKETVARLRPPVEEACEATGDMKLVGCLSPYPGGIRR